MVPPEWRPPAMVINSASGALPIWQPVILVFPMRESFNFDCNLLVDLYFASILLINFELVLRMARNMSSWRCCGLLMFC